MFAPELASGAVKAVMSELGVAEAGAVGGVSDGQDGERQGAGVC